MCFDPLGDHIEEDDKFTSGEALCPHTPATSDNPPCELPLDYTYNNATGFAYKAADNRLIWTEARDACAEGGSTATLIEFVNEAEYQVLVDKASK